MNHDEKCESARSFATRQDSSATSIHACVADWIGRRCSASCSPTVNLRDGMNSLRRLMPRHADGESGSHGMRRARHDRGR
jgi:hypothetical protein